METEAILRLQKSKIFRELLVKENNDHQLSSKILIIVETVTPLLQRISENMPEFTLHDSSHSAKILEIMGKILPDEVLNNLNTIELSLLILSAYLHDIGMTCDKKEKEDIILSDDEYSILFKSNLDKFNKYEQYLNEKNHRAATFIQDQVFTEYLRRKHVERSANYISEHLSKGELSLVYNQIPFHKILIKVCDAHGEAVKHLYDTQKWPKQTLVGENIINVQFVALVLRLADIMDLDSERTPKVIYEFVNPEDPVSIIEWKKHRSILGTSIGTNQVLFEAECSSPEVERALRLFMDWIEIERKETIELLKTYSPEEKLRYFLLLNDPVTKDRIHSDGSYVYSDLTFNLDFHRIMSLLMGQKLYKDSTTAVRELMQNSLDAIKVRTRIFEDKTENFIPLIKITITDSIMIIEDNGVGMDESIFRDFFLQIGKSYYSSPKFYSKYSGVDVTSEFGIGILSVFMIASSITIESRKEPDNPNNPFTPIYYDIPTAHSFIIQRQGKRKGIGTSITLKLMDSNPFKNKSAVNILEEIIPNPPFPILLNQVGLETNYIGKKVPLIPELVYNKEDMYEFLQHINYNDTEWRMPFTHSLLTIDFQSGPNAILEIEGDLIIVNTNPVNYYGKLTGFISQRNFTVGYPETKEDIFEIKMTESILGLFPKWISGFSTLNLKGNSSLSISPERSDLIVDEKYKIIKSKIEQKIISAFRIHFDNFISHHGVDDFNKYMDFLYVSGFFGIDLGNRSEPSDISKSFLREYVTFPVLHDSGKVERVKAKDLFLKKNIGVINGRCRKESVQDLLKFKKENDLEIVILNATHYSSGRIESLFESLMGSRGHFLKPLKLLLKPLYYSTIKLVKHGDIDYQNVIYNEYGVIDVISNSESIENDLPVVFTLRSNHIYPNYNATHPIISFLFINSNTTFEFEKLRNNLTKGIVKALEKSSLELKESGNKDLMEVAFGNDTHEFTKGILKRDPKLIDRLNTVFEELHTKAKFLKLIDDLTQTPKLTPADLPWHWS
jgi:Molecular chaperone, HSP90 family